MTSAVPESKILLPPPSKPVTLSDRLTSLLNRIQPSPETVVLVSALLIGGGSGLAMVLFHILIDLCQSLSYGQILGFISKWGTWTLACIPMLGGAIVGFMRWRYPEVLGQGFAALLSNTRSQKISPFRPAIKMLAAIVSLGTGASLGPEGPSVEIGANVGILLGQAFQVSKERYRLLLGTGAAAGLAAGFNAPITSIFFALEVILGPTFTTPAISLIFLSTVVSAVIARIALGVYPAFELPTYQVLSHWEWLLYLGLGFLASYVSMLFIQGIQLAQAGFQGDIPAFSWLKHLPQGFKPVLGGACVGLVALKLPQILGVGYDTLETILRGEVVSLPLLGLLLVAKLGLTAISLGSGLVGGIFAPAMFLGACMGAIYGQILDLLLPTELGNIAPPPAYAIVGMAAVLAGSVRAPLTAIILLFELTQNYLIILPAMAAVGMSVWLVDQFKSSQSVQSLNLQQMGVNLEQQDESEMLQQTPTAIIVDPNYLSLLDSTSLLEAGRLMVQHKCHTALVLNPAQDLTGIITLADIKRRIVAAANSSTDSQTDTQTDNINQILHQPLKDICTSEVLYAYPDEPVAEVLERMGTRGLYLLPVVERENPRKVMGIVERHRIGLASDLIVTQQALQPYVSQEK
ncbi:MAG: chloride channel protein [Leptolyngbyaceae cyanobacterium HOT.MB2.61]|jgi:H+/Cl- antiporter ClcA/CBS domain-containing protein|nr:chloride channel protein [Leptolyngbyaceae cyanobacterium HOT.MB2.61]